MAEEEEATVKVGVGLSCLWGREEKKKGRGGRGRRGG
jgi:hypothetical protein